MRALLSIHDVMPDTLDRVEALLTLIPESCHPGLLLLVVPGLGWRDDQITRLAHWQNRGMELAGHGWTHRVRHIKSVYHRLHAALISRDAAEHLSLTTVEIVHLLERNHVWFGEHGLAAPEYYVPPAWAMGAVNNTHLRASPFRYFETTSGLFDATTGRTRHLPLVGFEADKPWRRFSLRHWNRLNVASANEKRPLRIAVHPYDNELLLRDDLRRLLGGVTGCLDYRQAFA